MLETIRYRKSFPGSYLSERKKNRIKRGLRKIFEKITTSLPKKATMWIITIDETYVRKITLSLSQRLWAPPRPQGTSRLRLWPLSDSPGMLPAFIWPFPPPWARSRPKWTRCKRLASSPCLFFEAGYCWTQKLYHRMMINCAEQLVWS